MPNNKNTRKVSLSGAWSVPFRFGQPKLSSTSPALSSPASSIASSPYWGVQTTQSSQKQRKRRKQKQGKTITTPNNNDDDVEGFSPFVAFCFTINYILGTGFLTIPWAFVQGGVVLSTIVLLTMCIVSDIAKDYILESMAKAEAMLDHRMHWIKNNATSTTLCNNQHTTTINTSHNTNLKDNSSCTNNGANDDEEENGEQDEEKQSLLKYIAPNQTGCIRSTGSGKYQHSAYYGATTTTKISTSLPATPITGSSVRYVIPATNIAAIKAQVSTGTPLLIGRGTTACSVEEDAMRSLSKHNTIINEKQTAPLLDDERDQHLVKDRKFEINALCRVFIGKSGVHVYTYSIALYIYGLLWAYTSVFASALAKVVPILPSSDGSNSSAWPSSSEPSLAPYSLSFLSIFGDDYTFYAFIFALFVVPLTCLELNEQIPIQVFLTGCRFAMVALMIGTSSLCASTQGADNHITGVDDYDSNGNSNQALMFNPSGLHKMLPILVLATIYHHSIPGISQQVADKKKLSSIFRSTVIFCAIAYSLIGFILGSAFGNQVEQSANLNWQGCFNLNNNHSQHYFDDESNVNYISSSSHSNESWWWARPVSLFIVCFPALDVISGFPLNAITLANNIMGAFYGSRIHEVEKNRWIVTWFRLLASIPPIVLALLVRELGVITDYAGTIGFIITFSIPSLLYVQSVRIAKRKHFSLSSYYTKTALYRNGFFFCCRRPRQNINSNCGGDGTTPSSSSSLSKKNCQEQMSFINDYILLPAFLFCFGIIMVFYVIVLLVTQA